MQALCERCVPLKRVVTYRQVGDVSGAFDRLQEVCKIHKLPIEQSKRPDISSDRLVFLFSWQFLLDSDLQKCIVFHDSLLPLLRGFSPTVTTILLDERIIGVTAMQPMAGVDTGPVYATRAAERAPGMDLKTSLDMQTNLAVELALDILEQAKNGPLIAQPQSDARATYSLWRDEFDYFIDWRRSAESIAAQVRAVGYPFDGAKAILVDQLVRIDAVSVGPDLPFAIRDCGKIWEIRGGQALVVCGAGTLWIERARDNDGNQFAFKRLRTRFLTADNAWIANVLGNHDR